MPGVAKATVNMCGTINSERVKISKYHEYLLEEKTKQSKDRLRSPFQCVFPRAENSFHDFWWTSQRRNLNSWWDIWIPSFFRGNLKESNRHREKSAVRMQLPMTHWLASVPCTYTRGNEALAGNGLSGSRAASFISELASLKTEARRVASGSILFFLDRALYPRSIQASDRSTRIANYAIGDVLFPAELHAPLQLLILLFHPAGSFLSIRFRRGIDFAFVSEMV